MAPRNEDDVGVMCDRRKSGGGDWAASVEMDFN